MRAFWENWTWKIALLFLPVSVRRLGRRIFDLTMFSNCLAVGKTSFTNYWRCACFGNIMLQKSVRKNSKEKRDSYDWICFCSRMLLDMWSVFEETRGTICIRNYLTSEALSWKKELFFLVWFARLWKSFLINKSYFGLRGVNHFAAKTGDQFYLDSVQLKSITNYNKTTNKLILITRRLITLTNRISALVAALESAVEAARNNTFVAPNVAHERIRTMYTWQNVARRTERVSLRSLLTHFFH